MKNLLLSIASLFFLLFLFIPSNIGAKEPASLEQVTLQLSWKNQFQFAGFYVATELGFYKDAGLEVDINEVESDMLVTEEVLSGRAHFGMGRSGLVLEKMEGKDVHLLSAILQHSPFILLGKKAENLKSIDDIKNKKIMLLDDEVFMAEVIAMLKTNNLPKGSYIKQEHTFNVNDLISGKTDLIAAYTSNEPYQLLKSGLEPVVFSPRTYGFDFYGDILFTSSELQQNDPELVYRFHKASLKGWEYAFSHINEAVNIILEKYNTQNRTFDSLVFEGNELKKLAYDPGVEFGKIDLGRIKQISLTYHLMGLASKSLPENSSFIADQITEDRVLLSRIEREWLEDHLKIRIAALNDFPPFHYVDSSGAYAGIAVDMLKIISSRIGFNIEPTFGSWPEGLDAVESKELDLLPEIVNTLERREYLNFTEPILTVPHVLAIPKDSNIRTSSELTGKTVVLEKGYYTVQFVKDTYPDVKIIEVDSTIDALVTLSIKDADFYIGNLSLISYLIEQNSLSGIKTIPFNALGPLKLSIGVRKDWKELIPILEKGLASITLKERREISERYVPNAYNVEGELILSDDEKNWLKNNKIFKLDGSTDWAPFEFLNDQGIYSGITSEYCSWLEENLNISLDINTERDKEESLIAIKSGEIDIIPSLMRTPEREEFIDFTEPYLRTPLVVITKLDTPYVESVGNLINKTVGVINDYAATNYIKRDNPQINYINFTSSEEALLAVSEGKVFAIIENSAVLNYLSKTLYIDNLKVAAPTPYFIDLAFGVRKGLPELVSILDKALISIPETDKAVFQERWVNARIMEKINWKPVWQIGSIIAIIVIIIIGTTLNSNRKLSKEIQDRIHLQRELVSAKESAEEATKAKSDFLANMSHEIRTPMNAIIGLSHLIQKTDLNPKQEDYIHKIYGSAYNLLGIINDILDFSKIEAGKLTMETINFDLVEVFDNLGSMIGDKAYHKKLELVFHINSNVPKKLIGDPLRLGQVLLNLANNAIKFTDIGEIVITAELINQENDQAEIKLSVRDTGIGLTEEQAGKLFQAFSQADTSTTRKYGGTGLGLSISKKLVELMGGIIGVESKDGEGSTFYFSAKFDIREDIQRENIPIEFNGMNVLIVDDNATSREVLNAYTKDFSLNPTSVDNGAEAIQLIQKLFDEDKKGFDLILMDYSMPELNGFQTADKINEILKPEVRPKYILVTGFGREEVLTGVSHHSFEGFILKPVNQSLLFNSIMQAFNHKRKEIKTKKKHKFPDGFNLIRGAQILLVEDNDINQQVAREILEGEGFYVDIAENGEICIQMVQQKEYDIILMDLQMPVMGGVEATIEIRKLEFFNNLPIVAMTADAMTGIRDNVITSGMNDYISKPIETTHLWKVLASWIKPKERILPENFNADLIIELDNKFPEIKGINTSAGLHRVAQNKKLYTKLLKQFIEDYTDIESKVNNLLENNKIDEAIREAHSIKGVSANLGAESLQNIMGEIEKNIKDGTEIKDQLAIGNTIMTELIQAINDSGVISSVIDDQVVKNTISNEELISKLQEVENFLIKRKPKPALEILNQLETYIISDNISEKIDNSRSFLSKYKMKEAVISIESLIKSLSTTVLIS
ncbi:MAG: transporter substrate-binding domain-containing protein [Spirochaetaceae bacterium]